MKKTDIDFIYKHGIKNLLREAPGDEEETEEEETEEEAEEDASEEDKEEPKGSYEESLDADLDSIFIDFETDARKSVVRPESYRRRSVKLIYEDAGIDDINISDFAGNVARLVKNYENLLDIEGILISRAREFIEDRYGEDAASALIDELERSHDVEIKDSKGLESDYDVPLALGAKAGE